MQCNAVAIMIYINDWQDVTPLLVFAMHGAMPVMPVMPFMKGLD
jgi:hypothetical protein